MKWYKNHFSQSFWAYITLMVISIGCFVGYLFISSLCWWKCFLYDCSLAIFTSIVVSLLIDFGNTAIKTKNDKLLFDRLTNNLKEECKNLTEAINTSVNCAFDNLGSSKLTYGEWIEYLFAFQPTYEGKQKKEINFFLQQVSVIKTTTNALQETIKNYHNNKCLTDDFRKSLETLSRRSKVIEYNRRNERYGECKDLLINDLKDSIVDLFPTLQEEFSKKYNEQDYMA